LGLRSFPDCLKMVQRGAEGQAQDTHAERDSAEDLVDSRFRVGVCYETSSDLQESKYDDDRAHSVPLRFAGKVAQPTRECNGGLWLGEAPQEGFTGVDAGCDCTVLVQHLARRTGTVVLLAMKAKLN
jgi:hypothetical protein